MAAPPGILEVRCAGCGETLEVEHGLTEFACPDCGMAQSLPPELMPPRPRRALPLPGRAAPLAQPARVACGGCGSVLSVPHGPGRFACPLCGIELASSPLAAVPVVAAPAAVPISSTRPMNVSEVQQPSSQSACAGMVQKPIHSEQIQGQQHKHSFGEESFNSFRAEPRTQIDAARTLQNSPPNPLVPRDVSHTEPVQGTIARPVKRTQIGAARTLQNELPNASIHREESHTEPVEENIARSGKRTYRFVFGPKSWQEGNVQKEQPIQVVHASQAQVLSTESSVHTHRAIGGFPDDAIPIHSKQRTEHVDVPSVIEHEQIRSRHQVAHEQQAGENSIDTVHMEQEKVDSACKPSSKNGKSAENTKGSHKTKNNNLINVHASQAQVMPTESSVHINQAEGGFPDDTVPMHGKQRTGHVAVPSAIEHEQVRSRHQVDHEQQEGENPSDGVHIEQEKVDSACKPSSKYIKSTENTKGNRKRKNKNLMNSSNERPHLRCSKRLSKGSPDFIDVEPIQKVDASSHQNHSEAPQVESSIADQTYSPETGWALPNPGSSSWHEQEIPQKSFNEIDQLDGSDEEVHSNPSDNQNQYMDGQVPEAACSGKNHSEQVRFKPHIKNFAEHGSPMNLAASCSRLAALLPVPASATLPTISSLSSPEKLPPQCSSPTTPQNQPPTVIYSQDAQCDDMPSGSLTKSSIKRKGRPREVLVEPRKEADKPVLTPSGTNNWSVHPPFPKRVATTLSLLIKQNYPGTCISVDDEGRSCEVVVHYWHQCPPDVKATILDEFLKRYKWGPGHEEECRKIFERKAVRQLVNLFCYEKQRVREELAAKKFKRSSALGRANGEKELEKGEDREDSEERQGGGSVVSIDHEDPLNWKPFVPDWMQPAWWEMLCDHWAKDEFMKVSFQQRKNRSAGSHPSAAADSRSIATHQHPKDTTSRHAEEARDPPLGSHPVQEQVGSSKRERHHGTSVASKKAQTGSSSKSSPDWLNKQGQEPRFTQDQVQQMINQALQGLNETWEKKFLSLEQNVRSIPSSRAGPVGAKRSAVAVARDKRCQFARQGSRPMLLQDTLDSAEGEKDPEASGDDSDKRWS